MDGRNNPKGRLKWGGEVFFCEKIVFSNIKNFFPLKDTIMPAKFI